MSKPDSNPSTAVEQFLRRYIVGKGKKRLCPTIKTIEGVSVNIDGPFALTSFPWTKWRRDAGYADEHVLEPAWVERRQAGESAVHVHVPWSRVNWLRLQYLKDGELPLIEFKVRISLYANTPPKNERGSELFWFYAISNHMLTRKLRDNGSGFSEAVWD